MNAFSENTGRPLIARESEGAFYVGSPDDAGSVRGVEGAKLPAATGMRTTLYAKIPGLP